LNELIDSIHSLLIQSQTSHLNATIVSRMNEHDDEDQIFVDNHPNPLPSHIVQKMTTSSRKRGWAGEEMEINHQYNYNVEKQHEDENMKSIATAVDLSQFRNEQVGKGYQSKGVIRQRIMGNNEDGDAMKIKVLDMSKKKEALLCNEENNRDDDCYLEETSSSRRNISSKRSKKKKKKKREKRKNKNLEEEDNDEVEKYLQCEGIRIFRKEIEKIYVEATCAGTSIQTSTKM
jgi:hypothetical protein